MGENILQSEIKSFFCQNPHRDLVFHDRLLTVFLLLEDRGRPSDFNFFRENPYLSIFANYLTSYRKREKYG